MIKFKILFSFIIFLNTTLLFAFSLNNTVGAAFDKDEVVINVADHNCTVINKDPSEVLEMVREAVKFWNNVPTSRLKLKAGSTVSVSSKFKTDPLCSSNAGSCTVNKELLVSDQILVSCNDDTTAGTNFSSETSVLALGLPSNVEGNKIKGAIILLNDITGSALADYPRDQFISVLAHEMGHAIGLGHSPVEDSLMFYKNHPNRKYLGLDDMDGVSYLYPRSQPIACGSIEFVSDHKGKAHLALSFLILILMIIVINKFKYHSLNH